MPTPSSWEAARNGEPADLNAVNHAAQMNQWLGSHGVTPVYSGNRIVTPNGGTQMFSVGLANDTEYSQPFTMSGTSVGRVTLPMYVSGAGANLRVGLYPDNGSGSPDITNCLASTMVPADWFSATGAIEGLANATGPLQTTTFNTAYCSGSVTNHTWAAPAGDKNGVSGNSPFLTSGNYLMYLGGTTVSGPVGTVVTAQYLGSGQIALPVLQPSIPAPVWAAGVTATSDSVVVAGGINSSNVGVNTVWTAGWDNNVGTVGSWSAQQPLPNVLNSPGMTSYNDFVYIVGGTNDQLTVTSTTLYAQVSNGQISSWNIGPSLPDQLAAPCLTAINGWLICVGGATVLFNTPTNAMYYAKIYADGSLSEWNAGPDLPVAMFAYSPGWDIATTDSEIVVLGGWINTSPATTTSAIQTLTVTADGFSNWRRSTWSIANVQAVGAFNTGNGFWDLINPVIDNSLYRSSIVRPCPVLSVPLHATGLTNGSTYHVVLQQGPTTSGSDLLVMNILDTALPSPVLQHSIHTSGAWTAVESVWALPMEVYGTNASGSLVHTWEDPSGATPALTANGAARATLLEYTHDRRLIGYGESTALPNEPMNANPTFTSGVSPWTGVNGTVTQSSAHVQGGLPFSGLLTPNGSSVTVFAQSEQIPVRVWPTNSYSSSDTWYLAQGWLYSPTGWATCEIAAIWFDSNGNNLSTSGLIFSLAANTWTYVDLFAPAPAGAAFASLACAEGGTPASSNLLYMSNVTLTLAPECAPVLSSVDHILYSTDTPFYAIGTEQIS